MDEDEVARRDWSVGTGLQPCWLRASLTEVTEAWEVYADWRSRWWRVPKARHHEIRMSASEMAARLSEDRRQWIAAETLGPWTAILAHPANPFPLLVADLVPSPVVVIDSAYAADGRARRIFRVTGQPVDRAPWLINLTRPDRLVVVNQDVKGWKFRDRGEPLEFEETDRYVLRNRCDRLTNEMLMRYASMLDIPLGDEDVLSGRALLLRDPPWSWDKCSDSQAADTELDRAVANREAQRASGHDGRDQPG